MKPDSITIKLPTFSERVYRVISVTCGSLIVCMAMIVLLGYWLDQTRLIQWGLTGPVMRFNTGVLATAMGLGIVAIGFQRFTLARIIGCFVFIGGAMTFVQFPLHIDLGIDGLFFTNSYATVPLAGSRMGVNSAVCYILIGLALALTHSHTDQIWRRLLIAIFASATLAIAIVANLGHITSLTAGHGWGGSYGMAVPTATCFTLSGVWLVLLSVGRGREALRWYPFIVGNTALIGTVILWHALDYQDTLRVQHLVEAQFDSLHGQTETELRHVQESLLRMADRWRASGRTPEDMWYDDATNYVNNLKCLDLIAWVDARNRVRRIISSSVTDNQLKNVIDHNQILRDLIRDSQDLNRSMVITTQSQSASSSPNAIWLSIPLSINKKDDGCFLITVNLQRIMANILDHSPLEGQIITIDQSNDVIYANRLDLTGGNPALRQTAEVPFFDSAWTLYDTPTKKWVSQQRSWLPEMTLGTGILLSILVMIVIQLVLKTRNTYREIAEVNTSLKTEMRYRAHSEQALRDTLALQQAILDNASHSIVSATKEGIIQVFNRAAEQMTGYKASEMEGKKTPEVFHDPQEVIARAEELSRQLGRHIEPGFEVFTTIPTLGIAPKDERQWTYVKKDGTRLPVLLSVTAIRDTNGTITGYMGLAGDITERLKAEENLRKAKEAAEGANRAKSEFLAAMSHELRTPLNAIIGFSQGLISRTDRHPLNTHQKDRLEKIHVSGLHLLGLINDILDIAKIESGQVDVKPREFDIHEMLTEIHGLVSGLITEKKDVEVRIDVESDLPNIHTDREKLKQVLMNLATNAIKFTEQGSVALTARIQDDRFIFSVRDTGIGIPKDQLEHIFDRFYQIRQATTQSMKGTGLGLTICKQFIELLNGTISVTSVVGKGSVFEVCVPQNAMADYVESDNASMTDATMPSPIVNFDTSTGTSQTES